MCLMNVIQTRNLPVLIQELIDENDVILVRNKQTDSTSSDSSKDMNNSSDNITYNSNSAYSKDYSLGDLDELDDFDNLDSDESNNTP